MLSWTIYSSFAGALVCALWPRLSAESCRRTALSFALFGLLCAVVGCLQYNVPDGGVQWTVQHSWMPSLGIGYQLGADGVSLTLTLLTGLAAVAGILFFVGRSTSLAGVFRLFLGTHRRVLRRVPQF